MKLSVLSALLAKTSGVGLGGSASSNEHLEATMILNDAVQFVENIGQTAYGAQKETNLHYMQELDRKIKLMTDEKKHVADADDASVLLMRTPE